MADPAQKQADEQTEATVSEREVERARIGMALGIIELAPTQRERTLGVTGDRYSVRLTTGERVTAELAPGMCQAFARECVRARRMVVLTDGANGPCIAGALQTEAHPAVDARGTLALEAEHVRLRAQRSLTLEVPGGRIELEPGGVVKLEGDRLVLDAAALVRILSSRVEVP